MKFYMIEGIIKKAERMSDEILKEHIEYTNKAMEKGLILTSGLKSDESGGVFLMKVDSYKELEEYLEKEPLNVYGIQEYNIIEFSPHYVNPAAKEWF